MKKLLLITFALTGCQIGTEVTPPAEAFALFQPHKVSYPLSSPAKEATADLAAFGKAEGVEEARQDALWKATLDGGAKAIPVTRRLHESGAGVDLDAVIEQAEQIFVSCDPGSCYVTEQVIAYEMLNTFLADGKLFTVTPDNFETVHLSAAAQKGITYALRLLMRNATYHAHLVAVALEAVGEQMSPDEKRSMATQTLRAAEGYLASPPCEACGSSKNAPEDASEVQRGVEKLRAFLDA